jgi:hypothetical protein
MARIALTPLQPDHFALPSSLDDLRNALLFNLEPGEVATEGDSHHLGLFARQALDLYTMFRVLEVKVQSAAIPSRTFLV